MGHPIYNALKDPAWLAMDTRVDVPLGHRGLTRVAKLLWVSNASKQPEFDTRAYQVRSMLTCRAVENGVHEHGAASFALPVVVCRDDHGKHLRVLAADGLIDESLHPIRDAANLDGDKYLRVGQWGLLVTGTYADEEKRIFIPQGGDLIAHHREHFDPKSSARVYDMHGNEKGIWAGLHKLAYVTDTDEFITKIAQPCVPPALGGSGGSTQGGGGDRPSKGAYQGWNHTKDSIFETVFPDGNGGLKPDAPNGSKIMRPWWANYLGFSPNLQRVAEAVKQFKNKQSGTTSGNIKSKKTAARQNPSQTLAKDLCRIPEIAPTGPASLPYSKPVTAYLNLKAYYDTLADRGFTTIAINCLSHDADPRSGYGLLLLEPTLIDPACRANDPANEDSVTLGSMAERLNGPFAAGAKAPPRKTSTGGGKAGSPPPQGPGEEPHLMGYNADGQPLYALFQSRDFSKFGPGPEYTPSAPLDFLEEFAKPETSFQYTTPCYIRYFRNLTHPFNTPDGIKQVEGRWGVQGESAFEEPDDGVITDFIFSDITYRTAEGGDGGSGSGDPADYAPSSYDMVAATPLKTHMRLGVPSLQMTVHDDPYFWEESGALHRGKIGADAFERYKNGLLKSELVVSTIGQQGDVREGIAQSAMVFAGADILPHQITDGDVESQFTPTVIFRKETVVGFGLADQNGNVVSGMAFEFDSATNVLNLQSKDADGVDDSTFTFKVNGQSVGGRKTVVISTAGDSHTAAWGEDIIINNTTGSSDINVTIPAIAADESDVGKFITVTVRRTNVNVITTMNGADTLVHEGSEYSGGATWTVTSSNKGKISIEASYERYAWTCCEGGGTVALPE